MHDEVSYEMCVVSGFGSYLVNSTSGWKENFVHDEVLCVVSGVRAYLANSTFGERILCMMK